MLSRMMLPNSVENLAERAEHDSWLAMIAAIGITYETREIETHPIECKCGAPECVRLLSVRRYCVAHTRARRIRYAAKLLQERLDEHVSDENNRLLNVAHTDAIKEDTDRYFKKESQDETR